GIRSRLPPSPEAKPGVDSSDCVDSVHPVRHASDAGSAMRLLTRLNDAIRGLAYSPDGRRLATLAHDSLVHLYDPATGDIERTSGGEGDAVLTVAFRPDGAVLALAGRYRDAARAGVSTFDLVAGRAGPRLPWQRDPITELAYSGDGNVLVACSPSSS